MESSLRTKKNKIKSRIPLGQYIFMCWNSFKLTNSLEQGFCYLTLRCGNQQMRLVACTKHMHSNSTHTCFREVNQKNTAFLCVVVCVYVCVSLMCLHYDPYLCMIFFFSFFNDAGWFPRKICCRATKIYRDDLLSHPLFMQLLEP